MVDETKLNQFIGQMLGDLGGALSVSLVRIGDRLGLYKALHADGPMTTGELATKTNIAERYAREWLSHQAASGYLTYDSGTGRFTLPPEQAMVFAEPESPVYMQGGFDLALAMMENQALVEPAFRTGRGVGWGGQSQCLFCAAGAFLPPGLSQQPGRIMVARAGRHRGQAGARRGSGRCRLWTRVLHGDHGEGVPELDLRRLRLPSRFGGAGPVACRAAWG